MTEWPEELFERALVYLSAEAAESKARAKT